MRALLYLLQACEVKSHRFIRRTFVIMPERLEKPRKQSRVAQGDFRIPGIAYWKG